MHSHALHCPRGGVTSCSRCVDKSSYDAEVLNDQEGIN